MSNNTYSCFIDIEKLSKSLETIDSLDNCLSNSDLTDVLVDIENEIKKINFEHGNCISTYKKYVDIMIDDLWDVKRDVNRLNYSLGKTIKSYAKADELTTEDLKELSNLYGEPIVKINPETLGNSFRKINPTSLSVDINQAVSGENPVTDINQQTTTTTEVPTTDSNQQTITKIPPVTTETPNTPSTNEPQTSSEINTVPIGLGIAATGIAASAGAVVVGTIKHNQRDTIPYYKDADEIEKEEKAYDEPDEYEQYKKQHQFAEVTPYHASRDKQVMNKFYGEEKIDLERK